MSHFSRSFFRALSRKIALPALWLVLAGTAALGEKLGPLAATPRWTELERFQETITRDEFTRLLNEAYAPAGAAAAFIEIREHDARILTDADKQGFFDLRFASGTARPTPRYWRPASEIPSSSKPLSGVKIAIDPGHLGGRWAKMEERWFAIGDSKPVVEGDMTLLTAKKLAGNLRALGAAVSLVRSSSVPITGRRPWHLRDLAISQLHRARIALPRESYGGADDPIKENSIQWHAEKLFYRVSEIRDRARFVNRQLQPDLTICLHFNAERWGDAANPTLVDRNHLHLLINGTYDAGELTYDDVRFDMLMKLLTRCYDEELAASERVAIALAEATSLPRYEYTTPNARPAGATGYVWSRNLLANRLYRCPVVFLEPYVMNSQIVFDRVQLGDYDGEREVHGALRKSIYREYADAVTTGILSHYRPAP